MVTQAIQNVKTTNSDRDSFDLDALLHPAKAFGHPMDVVRDENLTLNEKRAILASWASDACAVEATPGRRSPPSGPVVRFDDIMEALQKLDGPNTESPRYQKFISRARRIKDLYRNEGGGRIPFA